MGSHRKTHITDPHLQHVDDAVQNRDRRRAALLTAVEAERVDCATELPRVLDAIRAARTAGRTPFRPLGSRELGILEWHMRAATHTGRLVVLEEQLDGEHSRPFRALRVAKVCTDLHGVVGVPIADPHALRVAAAHLMRQAIPTVLGDIAPADTVVVPIVRTGLIPAIEYSKAGVTTFGSIICSRAPRTLVPQIAKVTFPHAIATAHHIVLLDMVGATFGTMTAAREKLREADVNFARTRVTCHLLDVAPEGVITFLNAFPEVSIVTHSRSTYLDAHGMLADIGLGDADDLLMQDIDWSRDVTDLGRRGILAPDDITYVIHRTFDVESARRRAAESSP